MSPAVETLLPFAALLAAGLYLLPATIAVARRTAARGEVIALNVALGWTGAAWLVALVLAFGPREPRLPAPQDTTRPSRPLAKPEASGLYDDGWYILSSGPESATWAVCEAGSWRIVYEMGGRDRLVGPVAEQDVPVAVRADALAHGARPR